MTIRLEADTNLDEWLKDVDRLIDETTDDVAEQVAERAFTTYRRDWPVDTSGRIPGYSGGLSKRGLSYRLRRRGRRLVMTFQNVWAYAYWVEQRWYPIRENINLAAIVAAVNRDTRLARRLNRR